MPISSCWTYNEALYHAMERITNYVSVHLKIIGIVWKDRDFYRRKERGFNAIFIKWNFIRNVLLTLLKGTIIFLSSLFQFLIFLNLLEKSIVWLDRDDPKHRGNDRLKSSAFQEEMKRSIIVATNVIHCIVWSVSCNWSIDLWYYGQYREIRIFDTISNALILEGPIQAIVFVRSSSRKVCAWETGFEESEKFETEGNYTSWGVKTWNFFNFLNTVSNAILV